MSQNKETQEHRDMEIKKGQLSLSKDFEVLITIYERTVIFGEKITYSDLKNILNNENWAKNQVSLSLDRLYDRNMIDVIDAFIKPDVQARCYCVSDRFLPYTQGLYNALERNEEADNVVENIEKRKKEKIQSTKHSVLVENNSQKEKEFI